MSLLILLVADFVILFFMIVFGGLAQSPLQELPLLYWVLLLAYPALYLPILLFPEPGRLQAVIKIISKDGKAKSFVWHALGGGLLLLNAYFNQIQHPDWGGLNAFLFVLGSTWLVSTFVLYRRFQVLNKQ
jgi:hypothetical protein